MLFFEELNKNVIEGVVVSEEYLEHLHEFVPAIEDTFGGDFLHYLLPLDCLEFDSFD